jgi:Ca2+-binding RTX toxin-like protein
LNGGAGNDTLNGGVGTDTASYAGAGAAVTVNLALTTAQATGGAGTDRLLDIENLIGSNFNDVLTGSAAANRIEGGNGNDRIIGAAGADTLLGGEGNDLFLVGTFADHAAGEVIDGEGGTDELRYIGTGAGTLVLTSGVSVERIVIGTGTGATASLTGTAAINVDASALTADVTMIGNAGGNRLIGGSGNDRLEGGAGNDTLVGGAGDDTLIGGTGLDLVSYAGATEDLIINLSVAAPFAVGGFGTDSILGIEGLEGGSGNDSLTGDTLANLLVGGAGNDTLTGGAGNDTLNGGVGTDSLLGGDGNDLFLVDAFSDHTAGEAIVGEAGIDELRYTGTSAGTLVLGAGVVVERVVIGTGTAAAAVSTGTAAINIDGSALTGSVTMIGNAGANRLTGGLGNDSLSGGTGNDILEGGAGNDTLVGGVGVDVASYAAATTDLAINLVATGTITVAGFGIDSLSGIEGLEGGSGNDSLTGDAAANLLIGGAGNDTLTGGSGNDTLVGGEGDDSLVGGLGVDVASYATATADLEITLVATGTLEVEGFGTDSLSSIEGLEGGSGNDSLTGDAFANLLIGGAGNDTLNGGAGNDTLNGGLGTDTASYATAAAAVTVNLALTTAQATGGAGTDLLIGIEGLIGSDFNDVLTGSTAANRIEGGNGNDRITGGAGADSLFGGEGNDLFIISAFVDHAAGEVIVGDAGNDELRYVGTTAGTLVLTSGVSVERVVIGTGTLANAVATGTTAINVDGSALAGSVTMIGNAGANRLTGGAGNDSLEGGSGNDTLAGGAGNDTLVGGTGVDVASYAAATTGLVISLVANGAMAVDGFGTDSLVSIEGLEGGSFNDSLTGDAGANLLLGGLGDDTLNGGAGNDTLNGGLGVDTATYADAGAGVTVSLAVTTAQVTGGAGTDLLVGIENLIGSSLSDVLTGNAGANRIEGGDGNDRITGGAGADTLVGGEGNDLFIVSTFADHATGEVIDGGAGTDELRYTGTTAGTLVLGAGVSVERVVIGTGIGTTAVASGTAAINVDGSALTDGVTIIGNSGANRLIGGAGNDSLEGGNGNDVLIGDTGDDKLVGGAGNDVLTGGLGADEFIFRSVTSGIDVITDFNGLDGAGDEGDLLVFQGIGIGGFAYLGSDAFTGGSDNTEARVSGNQVLIDINGDGTADIRITLTGLVSADQLSADDFLFI